MRHFYLKGLLFLSQLIGLSAWGKDGHEIVANIAWNLLKHETQQRVETLLFPNGFNVTEHVSPLSSVATWADKVRYTKYFAWTTPLHYVDVKDDLVDGGCHWTRDEQEFMRDIQSRHSGESIAVERKLESFSCKFDYERDCENDFCAVGAILDFWSQLETSNITDKNDGKSFLRGGKPTPMGQKYNVTTIQSMKFLVHIVGDLHQPLHVSRETDRGGNTINVKFPEEFVSFRDERFEDVMHNGWNLHSVWDDAIIQKSIKINFDNSQYLLQKSIEKELLTADNVERWSSCHQDVRKDCISEWAQESFHSALEYAYVDEHGYEIVDGVSLSQEYYQTRLNIVRHRLAAGGVRLAMILENLLE